MFCRLGIFPPSKERQKLGKKEEGSSLWFLFPDVEEQGFSGLYHMPITPGGIKESSIYLEVEGWWLCVLGGVGGAWWHWDILGHVSILLPALSFLSTKLVEFASEFGGGTLDGTYRKQLFKAVAPSDIRISCDTARKKKLNADVESCQKSCQECGLSHTERRCGF